MTVFGLPVDHPGRKEIDMATGYEEFALGDVTLQSGATLPDTKLAYKTYGTLGTGRDNVIVLPTFYTGNHQRNEGYLKTVPALDPDRYFIISINLLGNGVSSSPSNTPPPFDGPRFPNVTLFDNVACQHRLLVERFDSLGNPRQRRGRGQGQREVRVHTHVGGAILYAETILRQPQHGRAIVVSVGHVCRCPGHRATLEAADPRHQSVVGVDSGAGDGGDCRASRSLPSPHIRARMLSARPPAAK